MGTEAAVTMTKEEKLQKKARKAARLEARAAAAATAAKEQEKQEKKAKKKKAKEEEGQEENQQEEKKKKKAKKEEEKVDVVVVEKKQEKKKKKKKKTSDETAVVTKEEKKKKKRKAEEVEGGGKKQKKDAAAEQKKDAAAVDEAEAGARREVAYPPAAPPVPGNTTILLFYAYVAKPLSYGGQTAAIKFCMDRFRELDVTGRLRVAREGYNGTLTGSFEGIRAFTKSLERLDWATFGENRVDFKYVDRLPDNQKLKGIKCWPVAEIVTYGFDSAKAPLDLRGTHLTPEAFHEALQDPGAVAIDVRNFNETLIGKFAPLNGASVLDPQMRRSTEFPQWVEDNKPKMEGKKVLMYCTGGVRCERASAFMRGRGVQNVYQLEGGIHRYLEKFQEDGGHWIGKNYTFDKRFSHGAENAETISKCVCCGEGWDRYQAQAKCSNCSMEVLLCRPCQRRPEGPPPKASLKCPLCK